MHAPLVALVGRPNVGKSTLFNQLTRSRDALVADEPGLTRDRRYGFARLGAGHIILVDTGGIVVEAETQSLEAAIVKQSMLAIEEADLVLLVVDARSGLTPADEFVVAALRQRGRRVLLVVNKSEGLDLATAASEFFSLGFEGPIATAAVHKQGVERLRDAIQDLLPQGWDQGLDQAPGAGDDIRLALVGRPNAGKSTLFNRLLHEERSIASDVPGTTRDTVEVPLTWEGQQYTLIDTAGLRRRGRVQERIEKFSAIKTLQAIESAHVVVMLLDARAEVSAQDARILSEIAHAGKSLVLGLNKWDGLSADERGRFESEVERKLSFCDYAAVVHLSALHGSGLGELMQAVHTSSQVAFVDLPTPALTDTLAAMVRKHAPPQLHGRRPKLRYAHQGGKNPPRIVIHGNQAEKVPASYKRYLINGFREAFELWGTPLALEFRSGSNPYEDRPNKLSDRQIKKRQRMIRHRKSRDK
nr:ribosome biogenesis GTPase Der [Oceanococcus sp. HetDA_MAG_MS8]